MVFLFYFRIVLSVSLEFLDLCCRSGFLRHLSSSVILYL